MSETRWRLRGIPNWPGTLDVTVAVDTTADAIVDAIEKAAKKNGLVLERQEPLTWTCHVCGERRPDALIGVHKRTVDFAGVPAQENVRYCLDKPECVEGAKSIRWMPEAEET